MFMSINISYNEYIHMYVLNISKYVYECKHTGWQRPIGCLKLQVIFRKRATNYGALLRKMTFNDKASYGSSPSCMYVVVRAYWGMNDIILVMIVDSHICACVCMRSNVRVGVWVCACMCVWIGVCTRYLLTATLSS